MHSKYTDNIAIMLHLVKEFLIVQIQFLK